MLPTRASSPFRSIETIRSRLIKDSDSFRSRAQELEILNILNWPEVMFSADWDPPRLAETYWRLNEVGATFRSLKGEIGLRPIWHAKHARIRAHLFLAVLAYHGVHLLRTLPQRKGIRTSRAGIRNPL